MKPIIALILAATSLLCQERSEQSKPSESGPEAAIIPIRTLSGDSFNRLAQMLSVFNVSYKADEKLRTILVYASREKIAQIRRVVAELDRPGSEAAIGRNIDLTLTYLRCSTKASSNPAQPLPHDLEAVARQLRAATQYKSIEVWDTVPLRVQEGKNTNQSMRLPASSGMTDIPNMSATAEVAIRPEAVSTRDSGKYVRFDVLRVSFKIPFSTGAVGQNGTSTQFTYVNLGLDTAGDFKEGQKSVIGKLSGPDNDAIFVVIELKILD